MASRIRRVASVADAISVIFGAVISEKTGSITLSGMCPAVIAAPSPRSQARSAAAPAEGKAAAPAAAAQPAPQPKQEKAQKPHVPRKVAEKRVVDTRGATTNLSKYDQHLDDLADDQRA